MAEIQQYKQSITQNLNNLDKLISKSPLLNSDPRKWKTQCSGLSKNIKRNILLLEEEVKELPASQASHYVGSIKSFKKKLQKLQLQCQIKQKGETGDGDVQERSPIIITAEQKRMKAVEEVMKKGDEAQDRTKQALMSMGQMVQKGIEMAAQINLQLNKQIEQLDGMKDKVKDTHSTLKRAQKTISYFIKAMECDKCMIGLLIMIMLALVAVIVMAIKKA